jgi:1,4-dihydroxy-2-naphthoate octaprenyltransferase
MKIFLNYVGQLRLYSLADLVLLLVALRTGLPQLFGAVILHLAFLAYLESRHAHEYRAKVPRWIAYILAIFGLFLFGRVAGLLYLLTSYLYTKKTKNLGGFSPIFRALQNLFIVAGIIGYLSPLTYVVATIFFLRNLAGDFRDVEKDIKEGVKTLPIILGFKKSIKNIHLIATIITSVIWWSISTISIVWLVIVVFLELITYDLTPR